MFQKEFKGVGEAAWGMKQLKGIVQPNQTSGKKSKKLLDPEG